MIFGRLDWFASTLLLVSASPCAHYPSASTISAKFRKPTKRTSSFSMREKILRKLLSLLNSR